MEPKIIEGKTYWHYTQLKNWEKNNDTRLITQTNWLKLQADIKRNGIESAFEIDTDGTIYDGNNRFKAIQAIIAEGFTTSDTGQELAWIPVNVKTYPDEAAKWRAAMVNNEQFAYWNENKLLNYQPEFESALDTALININFASPLSIPENLDKEARAPHKKKSVTCPNCSTEFDV